MTQSSSMSYRSGDSDGDCTGGSSGSSESSSESSDEPEQSSQPAPASVKKQRRYTCDLCRARKVRLDCSLADSFDRTNAKTKNQGCSAWTARQENAHVPRAHRPRQQGRSKRMRVVAGGSLGHGAASALPRPPPPPHQHPSSAPAPCLPRRRDISFPVIHTREPGAFLGVPMRHGRGT